MIILRCHKVGVKSKWHAISYTGFRPHIFIIEFFILTFAP